MHEFELIQHYFSSQSSAASSALPFGFVGIGDDAALLPISDAVSLAVSTDSLLEGTHFFADMPPRALGHKALAVNISDLAAMGATPKYFTLALHLPRVNESWLSEFQQGLFACAKDYAMTLIGGDTCRSQQGIGINITVMGEVNRQHSLLRNRAQQGDAIYVSGHLGESALGLLGLQKKIPLDQAWLTTHYYPQPQIALGQALLGVAHAAIDISDGLLADLGHILKASGVGAYINHQQIPLARSSQNCPESLALQCALTGGEDYQLCFTVPAAQQAAIEKISARFALTKIGEIVAGNALTFDPPLPNTLDSQTGFRHF
jgi:thiamine-monophosphate kinase